MMLNRFFAAAACALLLAAGCTANKSSNPLSPTVAGPIPGVQISTPNAVSPNNTKVTVDQQPITLVFDNASSNGPRPLSYSVDVATDVNFATKVFSRTGVAPGSGRTSLRLPDKLAPERSYFWRARAEDGANTGAYSATASFDVYTPIVLREPVPKTPINNVTVTSLRPTFTFTNAPHSGPLGPLSYVIQVALDYGFSETFTIGPIAEQAGETSVQSPNDGAYNTYYFWRVRAQDQTTVGPWSAPQAFSTPPKPAGPPPPGGGGGNNPCAVGPIVPNVNDCTATLAQAKADLVAQGVDLSGDCGAFRIVALAASRIPGAGFKKKSGTNCNGYSIKSIMFADGADYLVLFSPGTVNTPTWSFFAYSDPALYAPSSQSGFLTGPTALKK